MASPPVRRSAWTPPPARPGVAWGEDPGPRLVAHYQRVFETAMHDMPFINPALAVESTAFHRVGGDGDWLGVLLTPWFLNAVLFPGGGSLWQDLSQGVKRRVVLLAGELEFMGDEADELGPFQFCPLIAPVSAFTSQEEARLAAREALAALLQPPPGAPVAVAPIEETPAVAPRPSRRRFLGGLVGKP